MEGTEGSGESHDPTSPGADKVLQREHLLRALNERISELTWEKIGLEGTVEFVCECGRPGCWQPVRLTRAEYAGVRAFDDRFVLVPGHELDGIDRVVESPGGYVVVEPAARGPAGELPVPPPGPRFPGRDPG